MPKDDLVKQPDNTATTDAEPGVQVNGPESVTMLPPLITQREMNERNERYWVQKGGQFKKNDY